MSDITYTKQGLTSSFEERLRDYRIAEDVLNKANPFKEKEMYCFHYVERFKKNGKIKYSFPTNVIDINHAWDNFGKYLRADAKSVLSFLEAFYGTHNIEEIQKITMDSEVKYDKFLAAVKKYNSYQKYRAISSIEDSKNLENAKIRALELRDAARQDGKFNIEADAKCGFDEEKLYLDELKYNKIGKWEKFWHWIFRYWETDISCFVPVVTCLLFLIISLILMIFQIT